jgi:hypothetical protein
MQTTKKRLWLTAPVAALLLAALAGCPASEDDPESTEITGVNLALTATATAPGISQYESDPAANAKMINDGILSLAYVSQRPTMPEDVILTWTQPQTFNTVVYKVWYANGQGFAAATIQVSSDGGATWQTVSQKSGLTYITSSTKIEQVVFSFPKQTATMLKLRVTEMGVWGDPAKVINNVTQYAINELEVSLEKE